MCMTVMGLLKGFCITLAAMMVTVIASIDASLGFRYTVGDSVWSIPPYPDFYTKWSSSIAFYIADSLVFDFESEFFNVIQVPRLDYESCTTSNPTKIFTASPAVVVLSGEGVFYYICNISNYCDLGLKISVTVHDHSGVYPPTPSPSPSPSSSRPSLPPLAPSPVDFLAPQPSPSGKTNMSLSPVPGDSGSSTAPPGGVPNKSDSNGALGINLRSRYGNSIRMACGWGYAFLFLFH